MEQRRYISLPLRGEKFAEMSLSWLCRVHVVSSDRAQSCRESSFAGPRSTFRPNLVHVEEGLLGAAIPKRNDYEAFALHIVVARSQARVNFGR